MHSFKCYAKSIALIALLAGCGVLAYKFIRNWQLGTAKKTGHALDTTLNGAAENLEKAAIALEKFTNTNPGEHAGKGLDSILMNAQQKIAKATEVVQNALSRVPATKISEAVSILD